MYIVPPLSGFPLELGTGTQSEKIAMMGHPGGEKKLTISDILRRVDTIHERHDLRLKLPFISETVQHKPYWLLLNDQLLHNN